jgi:predicted HTH domain antitoxin
MVDQDNLTQQEAPTSWELRQLVKSGLYTDESAALRGALRALFQINPAARVKMVISAYTDGDISLGRAASLLGVSQEEMKDILRESDATIHLGPLTLEELREDARNA